MGVPAWEWTIWRPKDVFWLPSDEEERKEAAPGEPPSDGEGLTRSDGRDCREEQAGDENGSRRA